MHLRNNLLTFITLLALMHYAPLVCMVALMVIMLMPVDDQ